MKATVFFYQDETSYSFSFEVNNKNKQNLSTLIGTAVNRFRQFTEAAKQSGSQTFKFNENIDMLIEVDGRQVFDTAEVNEQFGAKLKFARNKEGARRFAHKVLAIVEFALSDIEIVDAKDL